MKSRASLALVAFLSLWPGRVAFAQEPEPGPSPGLWRGTLTPMNHPDLQTPLEYRVGRTGELLTLVIVGPGGVELTTEGITVSPGGLRFIFHEPEAHVPLACELERGEDAVYRGRCTDPGGKWADLTMERVLGPTLP